MPIKMWSGKYENGSWKRDFSDVGNMRLFKWEQEMFILGKSRKGEHKCCGCDKEIKKGCYFYGDRRGYYRVCINCFPIMIDNFTKSLKEHIEIANNSLKLFKETEGFLIKSNLVGSL